MRGENPVFLDKLDEGQRKAALTGHGKHFLDNFVHISGEHGYIIGPTGSGKSNKLYGIASWLMHREKIIWVSSGKDNEIIPLMFLGKPVNIITPKYTDVEIMTGRERFEPHPTVTHIATADDAWWAVKKDHINIFEFRNAFWDRTASLQWMIELFTALATWTRLGTMPHIAPASIFIDESKWVVAGARVTSDGTRVKASEIITENAMEIRSYGFRLVIAAQDFTDVPPAMRENLPCFFLCSGADIDANRKLRYHCNPTVPGWRRSTQFKRNEAKFVDRYGNAIPQDRPVPWPLMPKKEEDRLLCKRLKVKYTGYHDKPPEESEPQEECFPELGRFSAMAIPPKKQEISSISRFGQVMEDE